MHKTNSPTIQGNARALHCESGAVFLIFLIYSLGHCCDIGVVGLGPLASVTQPPVTENCE